MNKKNMVDIDKFLPIIDTGISTMAMLSNNNTHTGTVAHVKEVIFMFFRNFVEFNAEMIDVVEFQEKNIFLKCVRTLKNPVDNSWNYDKMAWGEASSFFLECCCGNRKILSREDDFEAIVPFCIQLMKVDPNHAFSWYAFDVLRKASDTIGKKKMITNNKGLLEVLGTIADCGNDNVSNVAKEKARVFIKELFNEY